MTETLDPPGCVLVLRSDDYDVTGATLSQLRERMALLGPVRHGRQHVAYTGWSLRWTYSPQRRPDGYGATAVEVVTTVTRTLPRWSPIPSADRGLPEAWALYLAALILHEQGHVVIAAEAGRAVHAALCALPTCTTREALEALAREAVRALTERSRADERAYDAATGHGASQGCE